MGHLHHKGYKGSVEYSEEDNCLFGSILGLKNSLILYEGNTLEELRADFEEGVESYLERCERKGIQPEKPHNVALNIRIPSYVHSRLAKQAERNKTTVNVFVRNLIERQMEVAF